MNQATYDKAVSICDPVYEDGSGGVGWSQETGFFSHSKIYQKKIGRTWETISEDEFDEEAGIIEPGIGNRVSAIKTGRYRILDTYRPISRDQAIRVFLDGYDDHGGMMTVIKEALDAAGIEPLKS